MALVNNMDAIAASAVGERRGRDGVALLGVQPRWRRRRSARRGAHAVLDPPRCGRAGGGGHGRGARVAPVREAFSRPFPSSGLRWARIRLALRCRRRFSEQTRGAVYGGSSVAPMIGATAEHGGVRRMHDAAAAAQAAAAGVGSDLSTGNSTGPPGGGGTPRGAAPTSRAPGGRRALALAATVPRGGQREDAARTHHRRRSRRPRSERWCIASTSSAKVPSPSNPTIFTSMQCAPKVNINPSKATSPAPRARGDPDLRIEHRSLTESRAHLGAASPDSPWTDRRG